ncbi:MAG: acyl carrier protein [Bacteroidetes bacterium GWE2_29_8]|nr:MAG: acyl carrier protein [Bacteroidetes bacterium GWE2_29_8]OFY17900.1 MAG: acyl carrier protein [Bacteroidetes bacterium GWF2_29_10]
MDREQLKLDIKVQIIKYLNLLDYNPEDIKDDMPLFGDKGLELDSIDSLELIVMLEREYNIKINNPADGRKILKDINNMADYIIEVNYKNK